MSREYAKSYAQLEAEIDRFKTVVKSRNVLINKINAWLVDECTSYDDLQKRIENGEKAEDICDNSEAFYYRKECAESLLEQIEKWEDE